MIERRGEGVREGKYRISAEEKRGVVRRRITEKVQAQSSQNADPGVVRGRVDVFGVLESVPL